MYKYLQNATVHQCKASLWKGWALPEKQTRAFRESTGIQIKVQRGSEKRGLISYTVLCEGFISICKSQSQEQSERRRHGPGEAKGSGKQGLLPIVLTSEQIGNR